jgi:hypothetical protein
MQYVSGCLSGLDSCTVLCQRCIDSHAKQRQAAIDEKTRDAVHWLEYQKYTVIAPEKKDV